MPSAPSRHPFEGAAGILERVGNTPLVRLCHVAEGLPDDVEVWAKLESANPGGSVKDRPALAIVLDAIRTGRLKRGQRILDASSGNTGIAYAMIGANLGFELTLCLPKNANAERKQILSAYGVEVVETDPLEGSDGAIRKARELAVDTERYAYLDQYSNDNNWRAHYGSTGPEIVAQTGGGVTHFVASLGTSGTFMGTTRFLRQWSPAVKCYSVQPDSPFHGLEGLKHMETSIVPPIYDDTLADGNIEAPTEESFELVRDLARYDGILVGPSCGAACWAALQVARTLESGVVVTVFPDSGERYLSESHLWNAP
ncbi:MAG: cysteine synthase family protein [Deltaproteobacteria bacterium]|nr:cysteine synthase family protein [Deltaproteobacteria bacterium]